MIDTDLGDSGVRPRVRALCLALAALGVAGACCAPRLDPLRIAGVAAAALVAASTCSASTRGAWSGLRVRPAVLWSAWLALSIVATGAWILAVQPVWGKPIALDELGLACSLAAFVLTPFCVRAHRPANAWRGPAQRALVALTSLFATLFALELALRVFHVRADGFGVTAMHRAWMELHWKPVNSLGFRDREPRAQAGVKRVLVLGDSFAAGHGIDELDDTFASVLGRELGAGWSVNVAAKPGWSTDAEFAALARYPLAPDVAVLSYYVNDMAYLLGKGSQALAHPPAALEWFAGGFFTTSWVYWHVLRGGIDEIQDAHGARQTSAYADEVLWARHAADLSRIAALARERSIALVVVVWPLLDDVESSRAATARVAELFRAQGVSVLDLTPAFAARPARELVQSRSDAHPNAALHAEVGKLLAPIVRGLR